MEAPHGEGEEVCPRCQAGAVGYDDFQGLRVCESCGAVLEETELVSYGAAFLEDGPQGVWVGADDSGRRAGAYLLHGTVGRDVQRSSRNTGQAILRARVKEVSNQLQMTQAVTDQALHFLEQLIPTLMGSWRRDHIVAAATYAAARCNQLPVSLVDLSGVLHVDVYTLGKHYRAALQLLGLKPPPLEPELLLARCLDRLAASLRGAGRLPEGGSLQHLQPDAAMALRWMDAQLTGLPNPQGSVGAAVVLAAEMGNVEGVSLEALAPTLCVVRDTIHRKLQQVKRKLLELSQLLPYRSNITAKNVGSHARTIIKLSGVLIAAGSATSSAVPAPAALPAPAPPLQLTAVGEGGGGGSAGPPAPAAAAGAAGSKRSVAEAGSGSPGNRASKQQRLERAGSTAAGSTQGGGGGGERGAAREGDEEEEEALGEQDVPDAEMAQYLRHPAEVEFLEAILSDRLKEGAGPGARSAPKKKVKPWDRWAADKG